MKSFLIRIIVLLLSFSSCLAYKPDSEEVSSPDYNQRVKVSNAHYRKKATIIGKTVVISGTIAGGIVGYNTNIFATQKGFETKPMKPLNAAFGALVGYSTTYLINLALGQNKGRRVEKPQEWLDKINRNYISLTETGNSFRTIHKKAEPVFIVKNFDDVLDFHKAFPNSTNYNSICKQSVGKLERNQYPTILEFYPNTDSHMEIKTSYIRASRDLSDLLKSQKKYPDVTTDFEEQAYNLITFIREGELFVEKYPNGKFYDKADVKIANYANSLADAQYYKSTFPSAKYADNIVSNIYKNLPRSDLVALVSIFPNSELNAKVKNEYLTKSVTIYDCYQVATTYSELAAQSENKAVSLIINLNDFNTFKKYFPSSQQFDDIISNKYQSFTRDEVIDLVAQNSYYPNLDVLINRILNISTTIKECSEFATSYPDKQSEADSIAFILTNNIQQMQDYVEYFPNGKYRESTKNKIIETSKSYANSGINSENFSDAMYYINIGKKYADFTDIESRYDNQKAAYEERKRLEEEARKLKNRRLYEQCISGCAISKTESEVDGNSIKYELKLVNYDTYEYRYYPDEQYHSWTLFTTFSYQTFDSEKEILIKIASDCQHKCDIYYKDR